MSYIFQNGAFDNTQFDQLRANIFATILNNCIEQLEILNHDDSRYVIVKLDYVPLSEKYSSDEQLVDKQLDNCEKFQNDHNYLLTVLNLIKSELLANAAFINLIKIVEIHKREDEENQELLQRNQNLRKDLNKLKDELHENNTNYCNRIHETIETIGLLKDELFETETQILIKTEYIKELENSRLQQQEIKCNTTVDNCKKNVENFKQKLEGEIRNHKEITGFLKETENDYEKSVHNWINKYQKETEEMDTKIKELRIKMEKLHQKHNQLKNIYTVREKQINAYLAYKERKRLEFEQMQQQIRAAIQIQAWWRGTMYRRCLGPYRKRKSKNKLLKNTKKK